MGIDPDGVRRDGAHQPARKDQRYGPIHESAHTYLQSRHHHSLPGVIVGTISAYSSTSGVVLPAFLPLAPGLSESLGGGITKALAMTMNVSGHLVDVSPLSTIGALCIASIPAGPGSRRLFNQLLAWGLSMTVVGRSSAGCFSGEPLS